LKPILLGMGKAGVQVKPVFLRDGKPIPVWELAKLAPSEPDVPKLRKRETAESSSRSEAAKKAWETIRRRRGIA